MTQKPLDPLHLDVAALAADGGEQAGQWPLAMLPRLSESALPTETPDARVQWHVRGEARPIVGGPAEIWLHVAADVRLALCCQRCLGPVFETVGVDSALRFVHGENQAAALDGELEDDVLALERFTDLCALIEDELLLVLPLVPRHDVCPSPLPVPDDAPVVDDAPHPFAALAGLKKKDSGQPPTGD